MTVAYSAFNISNRQFLMGADDKDANSNGLVSKIRVAKTRWSFCILGIDNPIHCLDHALPQMSNSEIATGWPNIKEVAAELARWTAEYTKNQVKAHASKPENKQAFKAVENTECSIVVFDDQNFDLYEVNLGKLYPPEKFNPNQVQITQLKEGVLHLHALATNRTQTSEVPIPANYFTDPDVALNTLIQLDTQWHDLERVLQGDSKVPHIGRLGSYVTFENGALKYTNCF